MVANFRVVLDTSAMNGDVHVSRPIFGARLSSSVAGDIELVVPEVVLDELVRQYPERIAALRKRLGAALAKLGREARSLGVDLPEMPLSLSAEADSYEARLRRRLADHRVRIVAHPKALDRIVNWAVNKRKPFKSSGVGIADALVWLTAVNEARRGPVILVSANVGDFANPTDASKPHPDLSSDLTAANIAPSQVRLVLDVETLVDEIIRPLALPDARAERLLEDEVLRPRFERAIENALLFESLDPVDIGVDVDLESDPEITSIDLADIRLVAARELAPGRLLLNLDISAHLSIDLRGVARPGIRVGILAVDPCHRQRRRLHRRKHGCNRVIEGRSDNKSGRQ